MEGSGNPRTTQSQGSTGQGCGREYPGSDPGIYPPESLQVRQRPQVRAPRARTPSCEPPPPRATPAPAEASPGLQPAGWGWWASAGLHTPPSSCPQSWDHWAPHHRRGACSPPRCLRTEGGWDSHSAPQEGFTPSRGQPCSPSVPGSRKPAV